jgi:pectate lyase
MKIAISYSKFPDDAKVAMAESNNSDHYSAYHVKMSSVLFRLLVSDEWSCQAWFRIQF